MARILSGKEVAQSLNEALKDKATKLKMRGTIPCLCIIRVGEDAADIAYENSALKRAEIIGVHCMAHHLPQDVSQEEMLRLMDHLNEDASVHGVLLLRPLPAHLDEALIVNRLRPEKDVDCMTDLSLSGVISGRKIGFAPCTAQAAMSFLDHYGIDCTGMRAVVIGRSLVFGKPAALMLIGRNATVTVCHTKTKELPKVTREADLIMVAAGHPGTVRAEHVREGQILIDVGINMGTGNSLCGDAVFEEVEPIVGAITPVPGGVGTVTCSILMQHVIEAAEDYLTKEMSFS